MAVLQTKYVTVGINSVYGLTSYGFNNDSIYDYGNISNTSGGARDTNIDNVYSGYDISILQWNSIGSVVVYIKGATTAPSNSGWDNMVIDNGTTTYTYARADATYNNTLNGGTTASWAWTTATNPMGTTSGAIRTVTFETDSFAGTAPVISSVTHDNAAATSVTATVNLSSNGSGGTLQYAQTTTNVVPSTGWQTSASFSQPRNSTRYYWASQSTNVTGAYDGGDVLTVGYLSPDSSITTIANFNIPNADTSHTITIANGTAGTVYEVRSVGYTGTILASRDGNGTLTVPSVPPDNSSTNYYITCYRTLASGGNGSTRTNIQFYTVTAVASLVAPTISSVTENNNAGTTATVTVNLSSVGSGGTGLKYAQTTTNSVPATGWQTSASFTQSRGTTRYYWASRDEDTANSYSSGFSYALGYIAPDTVVTATNSTIGVTATSASTTISGCTVGETYAVRVNNGSTNLASGSATTTSLTLSFTSSLPAAGSTTTYEIFSLRPTAIGGDGAYDQTNDTFTVTRSADNIPDQFTFTDTTGVAQNTTQTSNTITIAGMTTGTSVAVSVSGGTYSKNGAAHTSAAGTATNGDTFAVRHTSGTDFDTSVSTTLTVGVISDTFTSTTAAFGGSTFYVDVVGEFEAPVDVFVSWTGAGSTSNSVTLATALAAGDRVGFRYGNAFGGLEIPVTVAGFASTHWTDTSSLTIPITQKTTYTYKYAKTGIPTQTTDGVTATASANGYSRSTTRYFIGRATPPDLTVSPSTTSIEIATTDTTHSITVVEDSPNTNSSTTEYRVIDEFNNVHESRTGPGAITVTDVPLNDGFPKSYSLQGRMPTANGGNNAWYSIPGSTYTVVASSPASSNDPTIDAYGLAIYDHNGDAITSFTAGHSILRDLVTITTTLSATGYRDVDTGLTGISTSNCVITTQGIGVTGAGTTLNVPATFITGGNGNIFVRLGKYSSASTVKVTVSQYVGDTIGATTTPYGVEIRNGAGNTVIDENSVTYAVREIITLNPAASNITLYQGEEAYYLYIELVQGRYPASGGLPIPALGCDKSYLLSPPSIYGTYPDGSYRNVVVWTPKVASVSSYKLAMLVPSSTTTPEYYGGTVSGYGLQINDASGNLKWSSDWRQAVINNVIQANQFTTGLNQNGDRDVTTGYDGVTAPASGGIGQDTPLDLRTTGESVSFSNLNEMDPANTYVLGNTLSGYVEFYAGEWYIDYEYQGYAGGGRHRPAIRITGFNSAVMSMWRFADGFSPPAGAANLSRVPTSYHAEGAFVLARIV